MQLGIINPAQVAQDLLAVRNFSTLANYAIGDHVIQAGTLYKATAASVPGPFVPANWAANANLVDIAASYLPLAGGIMTGPIVLSGNAAAPLNPVSLQQMTAATSGVYMPIAGGTFTGAITGTSATFSLDVNANNVRAVGEVSAISMVIDNPTFSANGQSLFGEIGGLPRWSVQLGNATAEGGGNTGSDFSVNRYTNVGAVIDSPLVITRSTGYLHLSGFVNAHGGVVGTMNNVPGFSQDAVNSTIIENTIAPLSLNRIASAGAIEWFNQAGTAVGSISVTGAATAYNTSSDVRLKEDAQSFDAGPILDATRVYDFKWTATGKRDYGVVAQEANEAFPNGVTYDEETDWWGVDYSKYVPLLLNEVKALRARVVALEAGTPQEKPA